MVESKEFKFLIYIVSGIAIASFLYFIYKDLLNERKQIQTLSSLNTTSTNSVSNELLYTMLDNQKNSIQNQQYQLDTVNNEVKSVKEQLNYMINTKSNLPSKKIEISSFETPANHPSNQHTTVIDKIRKLKFNMI